MTQILQTRPAKARLSDMSINEVSVVDRAANEARFVVIKRETMAKLQKMTLKLPADAKAGLMDGLGKALDALTAIASMVTDAEEDDAAAVPTELAAALKQTAAQVDALAAQYAAAPPPAEGGDQAAAAEEQKATTSTNAVPAQKAELPAPLNEGSSWAPLRDDSFETLLRKAVALGQMMAVDVEKAGRKISGQRYRKLTDLHGALGKLLNELAFDEASDGRFAEAGASAAPAAPEPAKKSLGESVGAAQLAAVNLRLASIEKQLVPGAPALVGNGNPEPGAPVQKGTAETSWPRDFGEEIAKRRKQQNGASKR